MFAGTTGFEVAAGAGVGHAPGWKQPALETVTCVEVVKSGAGVAYTGDTIVALQTPSLPWMLSGLMDGPPG